MLGDDRPQKKQKFANKNGEGRKEPTNRHVYIEPGVQIDIDIVKALKEQHKTERADDKSTSNKQLMWTIITAGLVFIYTSIMFWQSCQTQQTIATNKQQFAADQRPWLWIVPGEFKVESGARVAVDVHIVNYGKTPAIQMKSSRRMILGPHASKYVLPFSATNAPAVIVPPNDRNTFLSVLSDEAITEERRNFLVSSDDTIMAFGVIDYYDIGGTHYQTDWCLTRLATGATAFCEQHNEVK